jgi:hypothetical protein
MAIIANNCQIPFPIVCAEASPCLGPFDFHLSAEPSFVFSWLYQRPFPWPPSVGLFGEGLGGGYCTPPNGRDVSEANSFLGGPGGVFAPLFVAPQQSYPQAFFARAGYQKVILRLSPEKNSASY